MSKKNEIQRRLDAALTEMSERIERGLNTASDRSAFDKLEKDAELLRADLTRIEDHEKRTKWAAQPADADFVDTGNGRPDGHSARDWQRPVSRRYADLFGNTGAGDMGGFSDPLEFFKTVLENPVDERLRALKSEHRGMSEAIPSDGGFSVPVELSKWLMDEALGQELIRPRADVWGMKSKTREVPAWNDSSRSSSSLLGGFAAQWIEEGGTFTASNPKMRSILLSAKKLGLYAGSSNEVLADGLEFREKFLRALASAIAWNLDAVYIGGSGSSGEPLGIRNDPAKISVAKETGQEAGGFVYENATKMLARLAPECHENAIWIANQTLVPELSSLAIPVGVGGSAVPALKDSNGEWRLLTRPVFFSEHLPTAGDADDIILVDASKYMIGMRSEIRVDSSAHVGFASDETYFRAIVRTDGQGSWASARTPANGDDVSWVVSLAERGE